MTFLQKSYGEYSKFEKPVVLNTSYEGSNDEEELQKVPVENNNNNVNVVTNSTLFQVTKTSKTLKETFLTKTLMLKL